MFVKNRLDKISKLCKNNPILFTFVDGFENPADHLSRTCSSKLLAKSNYISGPSFLREHNRHMSRADILTVTVPNPVFSVSGSTGEGAVMTSYVAETAINPQGPRGTPAGNSQLKLPLKEYGSFGKLVRVCRYVAKFIESLKSRFKNKYPDKYQRLDVKKNFHELAINMIIKADQEEKTYFNTLKGPMIRQKISRIWFVN